MVSQTESDFVEALGVRIIASTVGGSLNNSRYPSPFDSSTLAAKGCCGAISQRSSMACKCLAYGCTAQSLGDRGKMDLFTKMVPPP